MKVISDSDYFLRNHSPVIASGAATARLAQRESKRCYERNIGGKLKILPAWNLIFISLYFNKQIKWSYL
jgi:hypothetical protein